MTAQSAENYQPGQPLQGPLGLYLHVPFCAKECEFCAFYKEKADRKKIDKYLEGIQLQLKKYPPAGPISTVFFGGGTPTLLTADDLAYVCEAVRQVAGANIAEWTVECAPNTLTEDKIKVLQSFGVNRFSLGVQSFNAATLNAIGRPHTLAQTQKAIELLKTHTKNWNIDLIFAAADATLPQWEEDLQTAIAYQPYHISTYCLTLESDTELYLKMLRGSKKKPSADEEASFYLRTWDILTQAGFIHYELANFARTGFECQHNLNTWHMNDWIGYGPSAASQINGHRYSHIPDLDQWHEGVVKNTPKLINEEHLTPYQLAVDAVTFGLRLPDGIHLGQIQEKFAVQFPAKALGQLQEGLHSQGLLQFEEGVGSQWRLTRQGLLVADAVGEWVAEKLGE